MYASQTSFLSKELGHGACQEYSEQLLDIPKGKLIRHKAPKVENIQHTFSVLKHRVQHLLGSIAEKMCILCLVEAVSQNNNNNNNSLMNSD